MTNDEKIAIAYNRWKILHEHENVLRNNILQNNGILNKDQVQIYYNELNEVCLQSEAISIVHEELVKSLKKGII